MSGIIVTTCLFVFVSELGGGRTHFPFTDSAFHFAIVLSRLGQAQLQSGEGNRDGLIVGGMARAPPAGRNWALHPPARAACPQQSR